MAIHVSLLQQFPVFKHLPELRQRQLAEASSLSSFARRQVVVEKNAELKSMAFLLEGRLQVVDFTLDGKEVGLSFIDEGEFFGEVAMLDGLGHPEYVLANRRSQVVMVPSGMLRPLLLEGPEIVEAVLLSMARKLRQHSSQRQILSITNPLQRVCAQLVLLLERSEANAPRTARTPVAAFGDQDSSSSPPVNRLLASAPTHQELAIMVNLSRETVTRAFQVLQSRNLLDRHADGMVIRFHEVEELARKGE